MIALLFVCFLVVLAIGPNVIINLWSTLENLLQRFEHDVLHILVERFSEAIKFRSRCEEIPTQYTYLLLPYMGLAADSRIHNTMQLK